MKISVIVPVYNVAPFLLRCIDGLEEQDYDDFEVILVDDGSTDESPALCNLYAKQYDNVTAIHQQNSGSGYARNAGLERATGDYIYFCDPDDYLTGEFFQAVDESTQDEDDVVVFGYYDEYEIDGKRDRQVPLHFDEAHYDQAAFRKAFPALFAHGGMHTLWNKVYRRAFLAANDIRFTNAAMGQDVRFNFLVYRALETLSTVPGAYYHYVINRSGSSTNRYRPNRLQLQLEEWEQLKDLLSAFDVEAPELLQAELTKVFLANINHVAKTELSREERYEKMRAIGDDAHFDDLFTDNQTMHPVSKMLLAGGHYPVYDLVYRTATRLPRLFDRVRKLGRR